MRIVALFLLMNLVMSSSFAACPGGGQGVGGSLLSISKPIAAECFAFLGLIWTLTMYFDTCKDAHICWPAGVPAFFTALAIWYRWTLRN